MKGKQKLQLRWPQVKQNNYLQTTIALTHLIKAIYYYKLNKSKNLPLLK